MHKKLVVMVAIGISFATASISAAAKLEGKEPHESKKRKKEIDLSDKEFEERFKALIGKDVKAVNGLLHVLWDDSSATQRKRFKVARKAVAAGVHPDLLGKHWHIEPTLLHRSIMCTDLKTADLLLKHGANKANENLFMYANTVRMAQWLMEKYGSDRIRDIVRSELEFPTSVAHGALHGEAALLLFCIEKEAPTIAEETDSLFASLILIVSGHTNILPEAKEKAQILVKYGVPLGPIVPKSLATSEYRGVTTKQLMQKKRKQLLDKELAMKKNQEVCFTEEDKRGYAREQKYYADTRKNLEEMYTAAREQILKQERELGATLHTQLDTLVTADAVDIVHAYANMYSEQERDEFCWEIDNDIEIQEED